jgi:signal transduction histidine kinase
VPGRVFTEAAPVRLASPRGAADPAALVSPVVEVGPVLAVPLLGSRRVHGVLWAARLSAEPAFTAVELDMAGSFANHAAIAIELAEARAEQQRVAMLDERERIAADLHDHVIQRLFAAGLSLQSVAMVTAEGAMKQRLLTTIQDLDDTIGQIRATIFQLQRAPGTSGAGVRARLLDVLADVGPALGFDPGLRLSGVLEDRLPEDLVDDLLAVLREALTNVARHARAGRADVEVTATGTDLTLEVTDDGVGMGPATRRSGLANLRRRAEQRGGACSVEPGEPSGTRLRWSVPLS